MRIKSDDGVSPVVGVMLMLAVTVIIAAIVSAAAGGLSGTEKKAPSAILEVHFYDNRSYGGGVFSSDTMTIEHMSGNPLQTKDLSIATYFRNASGLIKGSLMGEKSVPVGSQNCGVLYINNPDRFGEPRQDSGITGYQNWFGNSSAVLMPGDMLVTPAQYFGSSNNTALHQILTIDPDADPAYRAGAVVNVKIVHIPTGQVIFDKDVVVI
ncbi:MAG: type IV pilin N-terminal domain-containing protein [Methanoregula sp.]|nr:type IV pilin N-terminal domain-containing protein [Methanoregula sp.]